jgi:hypothetical protein
MEGMPDRVIFVTITSKGNGRDESEIRRAWEHALSQVVAPGVEKIDKITVLPAPPPQKDEQRQPDMRDISKISLTAREDEKTPPKFYYTLDEKQWWEIPGELTKVWQLKFMPRDLGITEGVVKIRGQMGDEKVDGLVRIKSAQKHVLELVEP